MLCPICQFDNPNESQNCGTCGAALNTVAPENITSHPDILPIGTLLVGTYRVEALLGQGGFGITYRCHDQMLDRRVAVKEFFPSGCGRQGSTVLPSRGLTDADFREARAQFLAEARLLARCHHPGIVSVHTAFEANETAYMVMELLHGQSLAQLIETRGGRLPEAEAVGYIERTGEALQFVHDLDLLHRDIKPENIIVCDDGRVMLIDFGTAREYSKGQAQGHTIVVTPGYAPLEQYARQAKRGAFTDVYGLAATLYHLLTGYVPPAASDRAMGVLLRPVRQENSQISASVARAVETGLQMEIAKRPQSVHEFLDLMKGPVPENGFSDLLEERVQVESRPLEAPSMRQPVALYPDPPPANQELQAWLDANLNAAPQPMPLVPQPVQLGPEPNSSLYGSLLVASVTNKAGYTPSRVPSGGVLYKSTSWLGSTNGGRWFAVGLLWAFVGLGHLATWRPAARRETPPSYATTTITNPQSAPPFLTPSRLSPQELAEDTPPVIMPVSMETLPGSVNTGANNNLPGASAFTKDVATFSPDGNLLAYVDGEATVRVWDRKARRVLLSLPSELKQPAVSLLFSRTSEVIVVTYQGQGKTRLNYVIRAWNVRSGQPLATLSVDPEKEWVWPLIALPNERILVRKGAIPNAQNLNPSDSIFAWNARDGKQGGNPPGILNSADLSCAAISPDGKQVVTGDSKGYVRWVDVHSGAQKADITTSTTYGDFQQSRFYDHDMPGNASLSDPLPVEALNFSPNGAWLASRNKAQVRIFNSDNAEVGTLVIGHSPLFAISPDGKSLVEGGGWDHPEEVGIWDIRQGQRTRLAGSAGRLEGLTFSPSGQQIWGVYNDRGIIKLVTWQADARPASVFVNTKESTLPTDDHQMFAPGDLSPASQLMAISTHQGVQIRQFDGTLVKTLGVFSGQLRALKFSADGRFLAVWKLDHTIQLWNVQTARLIANLEAGAVATKPEQSKANRYREASSQNMAFSSDNEFFACGRSNGDAYVVDLWSLKKSPHRLTVLSQTAPVTALTFSPDNRALICGTDKGLLSWYGVSTSQLQGQTEIGDAVLGIAFSHRNFVVLGSAVTRIYALPAKPPTSQRGLRELAKVNIPLSRYRDTGRERIWSLSGDGQLLATLGRRDKIGIWQLPMGAQLQMVNGDNFKLSLVRGLAFSSDGTQLTSLAQRMGIREMVVKSWSRPTAK